MQTKPYTKDTARLSRDASKNSGFLMITGEIGSGREYLAKLIHERRKTRTPFVKINCSAVGGLISNDDLTEKINSVRWGTLFLENFHELDPDYYHTFTGLRCRIIASAYHPVSVGSLFKAADSSHIHIPPLRERPGDMTYLFNYFLDDYCREYNHPVPEFDISVYDGLLEYDWPFNISELKRSVRAMVLIADYDYFDLSVLPVNLNKKVNSLMHFLKDKTLSEAVDSMEKYLISRQLRIFAGNQLKAADALGITVHSVRYQMKKYGLNRKSYSLGVVDKSL